MSRAMIDLLIPNKLIDGPNHGKKEGDGYLMDLVRDARGLEKEYDLLTAQSRVITEGIMSTAHEEFESMPPRVFHCSHQHPHDKYTISRFVVSNDQAAQKLRFGHFLSDARALQADFNEVRLIVYRYKEQLRNNIKNAFSELMKTKKS